MKFSRTAVIFMATTAAIAAGAFASNTVRGSAQNANEDQKEAVEGAPDETRDLWGEQYDTSYTEHCGCTYDFTDEITEAQLSIVSNISPLIPVEEEEKFEFILLVLDCIAKLGYEILRCLDCSCESAAILFPNGPPSSEEYDSAYKQCCCDADLIKSIIISKMQEIADLPDCILVLHDEAFADAVKAIALAAFSTIKEIAEPNVSDENPNTIQEKLDDFEVLLEQKTNPVCGGVGDWLCRDEMAMCGTPLCLCDVDVEGNPICFLDRFCIEAGACVTNDDCSLPGEVCLPTTCCIGATCGLPCPNPTSTTIPQESRPTMSCEEAGMPNTQTGQCMV